MDTDKLPDIDILVDLLLEELVESLWSNEDGIVQPQSYLIRKILEEEDLHPVMLAALGKNSWGYDGMELATMICLTCISDDCVHIVMSDPRADIGLVWTSRELAHYAQRKLEAEATLGLSN